MERAVVQTIQDAIKEWEDNTPIRFVQKQSQHTDYVDFVQGTRADACWSDIGRSGGRQTIQLRSDGDCWLDTLIHEIGHTVGFYHEHTRPDRDAFVTVNWDNIIDGREGNFCAPGQTYRSNPDRCDGSISTTASITFSGSLCNGDYVCTAGDFDGDGKDDLVRFVRDAYAPFSSSRRGDVYSHPL